MFKFNLFPNVILELGEVTCHTVVEVNQPHLLHLQRANGGELLTDAGNVECRVAINSLAGCHVGDAYSLVINRLSVFGDQQRGSW